jgi:acyl carrier protein
MSLLFGLNGVNIYRSYPKGAARLACFGPQRLTVFAGVGTMRQSLRYPYSAYFCLKGDSFMTKDEVFAKVKDIIVEQLGADESEITMEASFRDDLEADSLDLVEIIMAFEEEFGGEISDEEAQSITTVGEAVNYLSAHS